MSPPNPPPRPRAPDRRRDRGATCPRLQRLRPGYRYLVGTHCAAGARGLTGERQNRLGETSRPKPLMPIGRETMSEQAARELVA
jgi:hypothetical protein